MRSAEGAERNGRKPRDGRVGEHHYQAETKHPSDYATVRSSGRRSPACQRETHQTTARIGGTRIVVYLHENANPLMAAGPQNQGRQLVLRNRQNIQKIAVVPATRGSSIVTKAPCAIEIGAQREEPRRQRHRPGPVAVPAPGDGEDEGRQPDPDGAQPHERQESALVCDRVVNPAGAARAIEQPEDGRPAGASRRSEENPSA